MNDTIVGDPLIYVPLNAPNSPIENIGLCYEIHGEVDSYFNLVSDTCTSVNAHWVNISSRLNVIDHVGIRAVDSNGVCRNISIDLNDQCSVSVDGENATMFQDGGVYVRKRGNRVRVSVPNCNNMNLVMWVFCETNILPDYDTGIDFEADMIKFVVMRGLNYGRPAHGIVGRYKLICIIIKRVNLESYNITMYVCKALHNQFYFS